MWIGSYKLKKNVKAPDYVNEQIRGYLESLVEQLKQELPVKYSVSLGKSWQSEACYLTIKDIKSGKAAKISFRNHDGIAANYDLAVYFF
ncbi:hypothetical protein F3157_08190 [Virgibacillus dakarensis]|nr:hypothetical protein [Virgibacillus dakarensis]